MHQSSERIGTIAAALAQVRGDPFSGGMGKQGGEMDPARDLLDQGGLDSSDFLLAQRLANNVPAGREEA